MATPAVSGAVPVETEIKFRASRRAFAALESLSALAGWQVVARRDGSLRDTYWDTPERALEKAGCTLRVRQVDGGPGVEFTLKGPVGPVVPGRIGRQRTELSVQLEEAAARGPSMWSTLPAARPVLDALEPLGVVERLRPDIVLLNPRRELILQRDDAEVAMALDEVRIEGRPYVRRYVELELTRGPHEALDALADAATHLAELRPARQGKVQAARAWAAICKC